MERTNGINPSKPWDATGKVWTVAYRKRAVLTDSGKRVKIRDNGTLPEGLLIPAPVETDAYQDAYIDKVLYADDPDAPYGWLTDYVTGGRIRAATQQEWQCSVDSYHEHGAYLDGTDVVFVAGGPERETEYDREADYWGQHRGE